MAVIPDEVRPDPAIVHSRPAALRASGGGSTLRATVDRLTLALPAV